MGILLDKALLFNNDWKDVSVTNNNCSVSIVIPVYKPQYLNQVLKHLSRIGGILEVILIDDSSEGFDDLIPAEYTFNLVKKKHKKNLGRAASRNTGIAIAKGEIIVFLDQDMFLAPDFIDTAKRLIFANDGKGIALGFRTTESYRDIPNFDNWIIPDIDNDWRFSTVVESKLIDLTISKSGSCNNNCKLYQKINIVKQTNGLKNLGISKDKTIGFWDLASMVISHSMAMSKNEMLEIGGFPEWIKGWGGEDIVVGFLAIANGNYIIPTNSVSYHIKHLPFSGSEDQKLIELIFNIDNYHQWAKEIDCFPSFSFNECEDRCY